MSEILDKIRSRGFWTVRVRPVDFKENRIARHGDLVDAVKSCSVELRGWDFPHFDYKKPPNRTADYIEQQLDWQHHIELWRAYRSGQFVSISALWFDWRDQSGLWPATPGWKPGSVLSVEDTVFRLVEVFEFVARWARAAEMGKEMIVECRMRGLQNRALELGPGRAGFAYPKTASVQEWEWKRQYPTAVLFSGSKELAIEPTISIFELFSWDANRDNILDIQSELRVRR